MNNDRKIYTYAKKRRDFLKSELNDSSKVQIANIEEICELKGEIYALEYIMEFVEDIILCNERDILEQTINL
jgi:hypothetical protein